MAQAQQDSGLSDSHEYACVENASKEGTGTAAGYRRVLLSVGGVGVLLGCRCVLSSSRCVWLECCWHVFVGVAAAPKYGLRRVGW